MWTSNQCGSDDACLFFGDRVHESDFMAVRSRDGASDKSFVKDVRDEGRRRGIALTIGESCEGPFPRLTDRRNNPSVRAAGIDAHGFFGSCAPCHAATTHTVEPLIR